MTQRQKVEKTLMNRGYITARQAYHQGIMRLAPIIWKIRNDNISVFSQMFEVITETIKVKNRDGSYSFVAKYVLKKKLTPVEKSFMKG